MTWKLVSAISLGAALLASAPAEAASCKKDSDCPAGQVCSSGTCKRRATGATEEVTGTKRTPYIAWGGIGLYNVSVDQGFGFGRASKTYFGFHAGGAANLIEVARDLPLIAWADAAMTVGSDLFFPLAVGGGVRYDKLGPVQVLGGLGLVIMPNTISSAPTPVGLRLMVMGLVPIPQLHPNLSGQAQISYDFQSDTYRLFTFTVGAGWAL